MDDSYRINTNINTLSRTHARMHTHTLTDARSHRTLKHTHTDTPLNTPSLSHTLTLPYL